MDRMVHLLDLKIAEVPKGSNRGDSLDVWAEAFGFKYKTSRTPGVMWCAIVMSMQCRYEGLPFWTPMAFGFVQQGRTFGYRIIPADAVLEGRETPRRGWICVRRSATGNHVDVALWNWTGRSGWVIGGNVEDAVTKRWRVLTKDRSSYHFFIEVF